MADYDQEITAEGTVDADVSGATSSFDQLEKKLKTIDETSASLLNHLSELENIKLSLNVDDKKFNDIAEKINEIKADIIELEREREKVTYAMAGAGKKIKPKSSNYWEFSDGAGKEAEKALARQRKKIQKEIEALDSQKQKAEILEYKTRTSSGTAREDSVRNGSILNQRIRDNSLDFNDLKKSSTDLVDMSNFLKERERLVKQITQIRSIKDTLDLGGIDVSKLSEKGKKGYDLLTGSERTLMSYSDAEMRFIRQVEKDFNIYTEKLKADEEAIKNTQLNFNKIMALDPNSQMGKHFYDLGKDLVENNNGQVRETAGLSESERKRDLKEQEFALKYYHEQIRKAEKEQLEQDFQEYRKEILSNADKRDALIKEYLDSTPADRKSWSKAKIDVINELFANKYLYNSDYYNEKNKTARMNAEQREREQNTREAKEARKKEEADRKYAEKLERKEEAKKREKNTNKHRIINGISQTVTNFAGIDDPSGVSGIIGGSTSVISKTATGFVLGGPTGAVIAGVSESFNQLSKGLVELYNSSIMAYKGIEKLKVNLSVISGSDTQGGLLFDEIAQYAIRSPFGVEATAEQATLLKQSGVYQDELMETLKKMGDLAGGNAEKMRRISNDYAMIVANGKANMIQLRQLANAGVPIYKEIAKEMGVTIAEVRKLSKQGEITADVVKKVIDNMTSEGGTFFNAVEKGSKTVAARTINLEDIKNLAKSEIGDWLQNGITLPGADESFRNQLLDFSENFWKNLYTFGRDFNLGRKSRDINKNKEKLIEAENEYDKALAGNDKLGAWYWGKRKDALSETLSSDYNDSVLNGKSIRRKELEEQIANLENELFPISGTVKGFINNKNRELSTSDYLNTYITPLKSGESGIKLHSYSAMSNDKASAAFIMRAHELAKAYESLYKLGSRGSDEELADFSNKMFEAFSDAESNFEKARNATNSIAQSALDMSNKFKTTATYKLGNDYDEYKKTLNAQERARSFKEYIGDNTLPGAITEKLLKGESPSTILNRLLSYDDMSTGRKFDVNADTRDVDTETFKIQARNYGVLVGETFKNIGSQASNPELLRYVKNLDKMIVSKGFADNKFSDEFLKEYNKEDDLYKKLKNNSSKLTKDEKKVFDNISKLRAVLLTLDSEANFDILDNDINLTNHRRRVTTAFDRSKESTTDALTRYYLGYSSNGYGGETLPRDALLEFARDITDTSTTLYLYQGALDESIRALENEKNAIVSIQTLFEKGSIEDVIRAVSESDQVTQDTFKKSLSIERNGAPKTYENEELSFENGRLYIRDKNLLGKEQWIDALSDSRFTVSADNLVDALNQNRASLDALSALYRIDSLGNKTLNSVRKDVVSLNFSKMLKDTNWLTNEGLKTPKYEKDGKTLTKDYEYAVNTFTGMVNEMYGYLLPIIDENSKDALKQFNDKYHKNYSFEQVENIKKELDYIRWGEGDGTYDFSKMQSGFKTIFGSWFEDIINELNGYANATDDDITKNLQPLWKRIIENNLGLDPTMFTNGTQAMQTHENEQYRRNVTRDFMATAARQGYDTRLITGMLSYRPGVTKSDLDGQVNRQIDWKKTTDNIKNFALKIGQAAEITSAYRQSVENEVDALADLLANMPTTPEDFANAKNFNDTFWNAFTGELKMGNQKVTYDSQTGLITAANGVTYALSDVKDQLSYSEKTMEQLEAQLKQRHKDLAEARQAEIRNSTFQEGTDKYRDNEYAFKAEYYYGLKPGTAGFENFTSQATQIDKNNKAIKYTSTEEYQTELDKAIEKDKADSVIANDNRKKEIEKLEAKIPELEKNAEHQNWLYNVAIENSKKAYYAHLKERGDTTLDYDEWNKTTYREMYGANRNHDYDSLYNLYQMWLGGNGTESGSYSYLEDEAKKPKKAADEELRKAQEALALLKNSDIIVITANADKVRAEGIGKENIAKTETIDEVSLQAIKSNDKSFEELDKKLYQQSRRAAYKDLADNVRFGFGEDSTVYAKNRSWLNDKLDMLRYGATQDQIDYVNQYTNEQLLGYFASDPLNAIDELNQIKKGLGTEVFSIYNNANGNRELLEKDDRWLNAVDSTSKSALQSKTTKELLDGTRDSIASTFESYTLDTFNDALQTTGASLSNIIDCLSDGSNAWDNFGKSFVESTKSLTSNMGTLMTSAGLKLLISGGDRAQAFALLAAGGLASVISGFMNTEKDDTDEKVRKLEKLKTDLKDLIQQAKADAIYYESNLSHKKALTTGRTVANYSVNDAIITPNGNVISTHPDDYLIATKTPGSLGKSAAPIINLSIQNNTGSQVQIKQTRNEANGQINIEAVLDNAINQGLADGRFDSGMAARERRLRGNVVYQ